MMGKASTPTAIQIRLPGIKGVLALAPEGVLGENEAFVRPSMIKLDSDQVVFGEKNSLLNVLKLSSYSPGYLNRQSILLLEALGISKNILLSFFHREKAQIESIGTSVDGATYYPPLPVRTSTSFTMGRNLIRCQFPAQAAVDTGFADDPMIQNITSLVKCRLLSELKWKAKIEVEEGTFLMGALLFRPKETFSQERLGIPDETGTLGPEEVFCQMLDDRTGKSKIVEGDCVIFRNPCRAYCRSAAVLETDHVP
jgi:RNA-dependent RNA polymerase